MITGFEHTVQLSVLLKALGAGYVIGLFYSVVMFLNAVNGKNAILVFIRDILFFVSAAIFTFLFALKYNAGIVRFYILAGEGIGFCLFYIFPGASMGKVWRSIALRLEKLSKKAKASLKAFIIKIKARSEKPKKKEKNPKKKRIHKKTKKQKKAVS